MRKFDNDCLLMCKIQGRIFEKSLLQCDSSSSVFIRRYMNSFPAYSMDRESFLIGSMSDDQAIEMINEEYPNAYGKEKYSNEEMYWIGYLYRYWSYVYEQRSKDIIKICSPKQLRELYYAYHSLDCKNAIDSILEARGIDYNKTLFEKSQEIAYKLILEKTA